MTTDLNSPVNGFAELALAQPIHQALSDVGYETPTDIQARTIPPLLKGCDVVGQAQTGTGKTAAFALPLLSKIDVQLKAVQVLVLAPTRELAIQVADGFGKYGAHLRGLKVLPIYGGQEYGIQLRALKRGVQVVVGTPGRVMDHMRRGTLSLDRLSCLVLDEADEMLHMGFIDDVEWILEQIPTSHQTALFSATMPRPIRNIAKRHLHDPQEIIIEKRPTAAHSIHQRYLLVPGARKINALVRILEMEDFDAVVVFVKTKNATLEVAEKLVAEGYAACALNGDLSQTLRERTVGQLKKGKLDILVATDVAARGLDIERLSHVVNYDAPFDAEMYVHRVGRTGRAGRSGEAILFLTPREKRFLNNIARATKQHIEPMDIPPVKAINEKRIQKLEQQLEATLQSADTSFFKKLLERYGEKSEADQIDIAAALAHLLNGESPILMKEETRPKKTSVRDKSSANRTRSDRPHSSNNRGPRSRSEVGMERYRIEVGLNHDARPANIVGAIANEAGIGSEHIGRIEMYDDHSIVDLAAGMPDRTLQLLRKVWVCNTQLRLSREGQKETAESTDTRTKATPQKGKKPSRKIKQKPAKRKKTKQKKLAGSAKSRRKKAA